MSQERTANLGLNLYDNPRFAHLKEQESKVQRPEDWRVEIVDHHTEEGREKLFQLAKECARPVEDISELPYRDGAQELMELSEKLKNIATDQEAIVNFVSSILVQKTEGYSVDQIKDVIAHGSITKDLATLSSWMEKYRENPLLIEENSRWIWRPKDRKLDRYIGPDEHRALTMSRFLGLVSFDALEKLRDAKIGVIGASVAASTIDLLVATGAENIEFCDSGKFATSNGGKSPSGMAAYYNVGTSKALLVLNIAQSRNPYGNYIAHPGNALFEGDTMKNPYDVPIQQIAHNKTLLGEVVDDAGAKVKTRLHMEQHESDTPVFWVADLGSNPIAGIEDSNWFNKNWSVEEKVRISADNLNGFEAARAVYMMVDADFPDDHRLQFLFALIGIPFWSQTGSSARESASIASKLIIQHLEGRDVLGSNIHTGDSPKTLVPEFTEEQSDTLKGIMEQLLDIRSGSNLSL